MRNRIERLRRWLLAATVLLVAVLALFIGSARYLKRHAIARLPARLGADIKRETNGFTYSQSIQGRTIFTVHAAKEVEHSSGTITLHDVSMILYGKTGDRADRVEGQEFEYDQSAGVLRAVGLVHMDLGASDAEAGGRQLSAQDVESAPKLLHATTTGLVYLEKLGVAATSQAIDFQTDRMTGHAIGADYNTDSGVLLLHSAVRMDGVAGGRPVNIRADSAQLDNRGQRVLLDQAQYVSGDQTMSARQAELHIRPDNTLERVTAAGDVRLGQPGRTLSAAQADLTVGPRNNPELVVMKGAVQYAEDLPLRQARGEATEARVRFGPAGAPADAVFSGSAHILERTRTQEDGRQPWSVRELVAGSIHTVMVSAGKGHSELKTAEATGAARLTIIDNDARGGTSGQQRTELAGDALNAQMLAAGGARRTPQLNRVTAQGHTSLRQVTPEGVEQSSAGDTLDVRFAPAAPRRTTGSSRSGGEQIVSAVQQGHVVLKRLGEPAKQGTPAQPQQATAQRAVFTGASGTVELTGGVRLSQAADTLIADRVQLDRNTGDAEAYGAVKLTYIPGAASTASATAQDPVHVLADRAHLAHATSTATFFGAPARLWQAGSQVQAPTVEISRTRHQLTARAEGKTRVTTILVNGSSSSPAPAAQSGAKSSAPGSSPRFVRVTSRELIYDDQSRRATFTGDVDMLAADEEIHSDTAVAFLVAPDGAASKPSDAAAVSLGGRLDRLIATGDVTITQPGRRATGNQLLYAAADQTLVLTGLPQKLPVLSDAAQGTSISAVAFRFRSAGDSVEALSSIPQGGVKRQVHTETPVKP